MYVFYANKHEQQAKLANGPRDGQVGRQSKPSQAMSCQAYIPIPSITYDI